MNVGRSSIRRAFVLATACVGLLAGGAERASAQRGERRFSAVGASRADLPRPIDDVTFRPTVMVRRGPNRGSGTIIASRQGRSFVLTAAHVLDDDGEAAIELHRFNLGIEGRKLGGNWPKVVSATVVAADPEADVALLRVDGLSKLPYVARFAGDLDAVPPNGTAVTSVGIDHASDLNSWESEIRGTALLSRSSTEEEGGDEAAHRRHSRLFLVTKHAPIHGRSGGGLFNEDGRLIGLCVARIDLKSASGDSGAIGLFASGRSIREVLRRVNEDEAAPD